jgi:hypothetical protein
VRGRREPDTGTAAGFDHVGIAVEVEIGHRDAA